jgi:hypothetical protein
VDNGDGTDSVLLGDPRNDANVIIAGLHCARILRYNSVLDELESFDMKAFPAARGADLANRYAQFLIARQVTLWHYQWLLVNEHLPQIAGQTAVNDVLRNGNRFYKPSAATRLCRSSSTPRRTGSATAWCGRPIARTSPAAPTTATIRPRTVLRARVRPKPVAV